MYFILQLLCAKSFVADRILRMLTYNMQADGVMEQ